MLSILAFANDPRPVARQMPIKGRGAFADIVVMKPSEKMRSDLLRSLAEAEKAQEKARPALLKASVERYFGYLPPSTREAISLSFENKRRENTERASEWLAIMGGIFLKDYDDSPLSVDEWRELRDILSMDAGELDMDLLSYAMTLVVEHKAL